MKNGLIKFITGLIAISTIAVYSTGALAGGRGGRYYGGGHHGGYHGGYSNNQMWAAAGAGLLTGIIIGSVNSQPQVIYQQPVYVQPPPPPMYIQQQPIYVQPQRTYYDPSCGCVRYY